MLWWTLRQLKSSDVETRRRAIKKLSESNDQRIVAPLVAVLTDSDREMRRDAVALLSRVRWEPEGLGLFAMPMVVLQKRGETSGLSAAAVEPLIAMLSDDDSEVRERVVNLLGVLGDARAIESLVIALSDCNGAVRRRSAIALDLIGWAPQSDQERALHAVALARWEEAMELGTAAIEPLFIAIHHGGWSVRQHAVETLGVIGDVAAAEVLITALADDDRGVRRQAGKALAMIGPEVVKPLIRALSHSDREVRRQVAKVLGMMRDIRTVEPLVAALEDCDSGVRWQAAEALGKMGKGAVAPLVAVLGESGSGVRWWAAAALEHMGTVAVDSLMKVLIAGKWEMRQQAAEVLGTIQDAQAVEPLVMALGDSNDGVRRRAAAALEKIGWTPQDQQQKALYAVASTSGEVEGDSSRPLSNSSERERSIDFVAAEQADFPTSP